MKCEVGWSLVLSILSKRLRMSMTLWWMTSRVRGGAELMALVAGMAARLGAASGCWRGWKVRLLVVRGVQDRARALVRIGRRQRRAAEAMVGVGWSLKEG